MKNNNKKRSLIHPTIDDVQQESDMIVEFLRTFLHNALFSAPNKVPHKNCPFEWYIESQYLIVRPCYKQLIVFVKERFAEFKLVGNPAEVGSYGYCRHWENIFCTLRSLYFFYCGELVLLYYNNTVWAFSKTNPEELVKKQGALLRLEANLRLEKGT